MFDTLGSRGFRRDFDLFGVGQQFGSQDTDFLRHGGREEKILARTAHTRGDLADRLDEAEVEHLVGFVKNEEFDGRQVDGLLFDVVDQAARRGNEDVEAAVQGLVLRTILRAAVNGGDLQTGAARILREAFGDLRSQFAGGGQDENARLARHRHLALGQQLLQDRQSEGGRLASAGLGDTQQVMAIEQVRDGLGLDRGRRGIAGFFKLDQQGGGQAEIGKQFSQRATFMCFGRSESQTAAQRPLPASVTSQIGS